MHFLLAGSMDFAILPSNIHVVKGLCHSSSWSMLIVFTHELPWGWLGYLRSTASNTEKESVYSAFRTASITSRLYGHHLDTQSLENQTSEYPILWGVSKNINSKIYITSNNKK